MPSLEHAREPEVERELGEKWVEQEIATHCGRGKRGGLVHFSKLCSRASLGTGAAYI